MHAGKQEKASPDYERPQQNVADIPDPVTLPTTKARQGETSGHMRWVLAAGLVLAVVAFAVGYALSV